MTMEKKMPRNTPESVKDNILFMQRSEATEAEIYGRLSRMVKSPHNREVLKRIAREEAGHYNYLKQFTQRDVRSNKVMVWFYVIIAGIFGITFGVKLMEKAESQAQVSYRSIARYMPDSVRIIREEEEHEKEMIAMIDEEKLRYVGSIVLGLNDALVELTGALAGLTLVLQKPLLVAVTGGIIGFAAALSMAVSEYFSTKNEEHGKYPLRAAVYTGIAYFVTVVLLIVPFFAFSNIFTSLAITLLIAVAIIFLFTFYISIAKDTPFVHRFLEMVLLSLGVAALSFTAGWIIRSFVGVEV